MIAAVTFPEPIMHKPAETQFPLHELLRDRWSPVALTPRRIEPAVLGSLFEAARWAPSSFNEQPWCFFVATQDQPAEFAKLFGCLVEANQAWAKQAYALVISCTRLTFSRNDKPNRHAYHDVGSAMQNLLLQAQAHGIAGHAMAGFDLEATRRVLQVPATHDPVTAIALGYPVDDYAAVEAGLKQRDLAPRARKPLSECVYVGTFGQSASW
jgi:nitroreductase